MRGNISVYPRVYGGTRRYSLLQMRISQERSIPACTGEPNSASSMEVYSLEGLSPRVRGNLAPECLRTRSVRYGKGLSPRVRGNRRRELSWCIREGLSPRVRGNLTAPAARGRDGLRSIPACTGEPRYTIDRGVSMRDTGEPPLDRFPAGLSPRVRGNRHTRRAYARYPEQGSIPACTGEPSRSGNRGCPVLGGSIPACTGEPRVPNDCRHRAYRGLSPRVRGNHRFLSP